MYKMKMSDLWIEGIIVLVLSTAAIVVMPAAANGEVSVTRDLPDTVYPGEEFNVSLTQSGFYLTGVVTETLPEGFKYRGVLSGGEIPKGEKYDETTNNLPLGFYGRVTTLIYKVKAGTEEQIENASFNGTWKALSQQGKEEGVVIGDDEIELGMEPTPTPTPTATPPSGNGGGNGGGGGGVTTPTATPAAGVMPTPSLSPTAGATATPVPTASPAETATPSPTPSPTSKPLIPGFEAVFAIAGLLTVAYLVMRRRKI